MDSIVVFGCGGHSKVVSDVIQREGRYKIAAYYDESPKSSTFLGALVYSKKTELQAVIAEKNIKAAAIAIGNNEVRKKFAQEAQQLGLNLPPLIDPTAIVSQSAHIGSGTVVMQGVIINAEAQIHDGVILNTGSIVEHDCRVGSFTHIAPGSVLCGGVHIGEMTLFGARSVAIPLIKIGANCTLGAGSVVVKEIPAHSCAYGNPAHVKKIAQSS